MLAAIQGHESIIARLLECEDIDVNAKDENGKSALRCAAYKGDELVVARLLKCANIDVDAQGKDGFCAIMGAGCE